jgi:hypothetical protein
MMIRRNFVPADHLFWRRLGLALCCASLSIQRKIQAAGAGLIS